mmetsp:Transcript_49433/g.114247  ORF Transcript_49433/g.114247 Transcript_49433/m.114247 type:complete len:249 (+) Transcript_49433:337-1083(+)
MSTFIPSARIASAAAPANLITSPCVCFATVGMAFPTRGSLSVVLATSETSKSWPSPWMRMSNFSLYLPKCRHCISSASSSGVSTSAENSTLLDSQCDTARSVRERKTLPLDQLTARGSTACSFATVVPLPVPESPCSTSTQPLDGASPRAAMISAATTSADLPATSILHTGSTGGSASTTPFSTACLIPAASLSPSSASRARIASISFCAKSQNVGSLTNVAMMVLDVKSSPRSSNGFVRGMRAGCLK